MANSVSNDALWEKLSEISEQLNSSKQADNTPDFSGAKDEIFAEIERQTTKLGTHGDINYGAINQNIGLLNKKTDKVWNIVARIQKQQGETAEQQKGNDTEQRLEALGIPGQDNREYFNFRFFKLRKTSIVVTVLGLLVLTLTLFCMKQQNDYTLLNDKYFKQSIIIKEMQVEVDSLRNTLTNQTTKKK